MSERTPQQRGRSSNRAGRAWQRACAVWLRRYYPAADVIPAHQRGDVGGCGDVNVECKAEAKWNNLASHMAQTTADATARGLPAGIVWAKRVGALGGDEFGQTRTSGSADPGAGYIIMTPDAFWQQRLELDRLQRLEDAVRLLHPSTVVPYAGEAS